MLKFLANLHSFVIYSYVGTAAILIFLLLLFRLNKNVSPRLKAHAYFAALWIPPLTFVAGHLFIKTCSYGRLPWDIGRLAKVYKEICTVGGNITDFLVPFFSVALLIGTAKALVTFIMLRKLISAYGYLGKDEAPQIFAILQKVSGQIGVQMPQLIITEHDYGRAFTFGIKKPVIVLSQGVLNMFSEEELEHVLKHECAHIKRFDVFTNWLGVFLRDISFFNPFTHLVFTRFIAAKEEASDDVALKTGLNPLAYGATLIKMWRMTKKNVFANLAYENISPNPGFLKKSARFEERVQRMLAWQEDKTESKLFWLSFIMAICFTIFILLSVC